MPAFRVLGRARTLVVIVAALAAPLAAGCSLFEDEAPPTETLVKSQGTYGACLPWYGLGVYSASMDAQGHRIMYLTDQKPLTIPEEQVWQSGTDRAVVVQDKQADGTYKERHILTTWDPVDSIPLYSTAVPGSEPDEGSGIPEDMVDLQMDQQGSRFVVAVTMKTVRSAIAKLYTGSVPELGTTLGLDDKTVTQVPINDPANTEGVVSFAISPDGSKLAAIVGIQGELRVFDFSAQDNGLLVYERGKDGKAVISHDMPPVALSINQHRVPLVANRGLINIVWSPDSTRLAIVQDDNTLEVGRKTLDIMTVADGALTRVRTFSNTTAPRVSWAADGNSLFVMNTPLIGAGGATSDSIFTDTELRRVAAEKNGKDIGGGAKLERHLGVRGEPVHLVNMGDDATFLTIWDGQAVRIHAPEGDLTKLTTLPIGPNRDLATVLPSILFGSQAADMALYMTSDSSGNHVALQTAVSEDECPALATAEAERALEEGGSSGDAAGEGDAGAGDTGAEGEATAEPTAEGSGG